MLYDYASTRLAAVKHKVINKWGEQMEQDWISESALDGTNALNNRHAILTLRDVLVRDLRNGALAAGAVSSNDAVLSLAHSIDQHLHRLPIRKSNLFAVCWIKACPLGSFGIHIGPSVDFFRTDNFLHDFKPIPSYETIVLRDLSRMDYYDILALALQKTPVKPISLGPSVLLSHLLNAEVPKSVAANKHGSVARCFLEDFFDRTLREKWEFEHPFIHQSSQNTDELTEKETEQMIRDVYVFNKVSLYQELAALYSELSCEKHS